MYKFKTLLLIIFSFFLMLSGFFYFNYFRYFKTNKFIINQFDKEIYSVLKPIKESKLKYHVHSIWINGYLNDTAILYNNVGKYYLVDSISENYFYDFYYGEEDAYMRFDPYKATDGKLKVIHKIR